MVSIPSHFHRLFQSVKTAKQYFRKQLLDYNGSEKMEAAFIDFCNNTLIANPHVKSDLYDQWKDHAQNIHFESKELSTENPDLSKILDALVDFLSSHWRTQDNALLSGHKKIEKTYINQMKSDESWALLLTCVGEDLFCRALLDKIILCKLDDDSYYQLSGERLKGTLYLKSHKREANRSDQKPKESLISAISSNIEQKGSRGDCAKLSRGRKRKLRSANEDNKSKKVDKSKKHGHPHDTNTKSISRADMFYSHIACDLDRDNPGMGLPGSHILAQKGGKVDTLLISSYIEKIFPNECKTPRKKKLFLKRIKQFPDLLLQISEKHRRKGLLFLLDSRCPKRIVHADVDCAASSHKEVTQFVISVLDQMFPSSFWGSSDHNFKAICKAVKGFVNRHVNENVQLKEILCNYKIKDCKWLAPPNNPDKMVTTDLLRRQDLLSQVMFWLFNDYIKPILRHTFHITEHAKYSRRVFYFRKDVWHSITKSSLELIKQSSYIPLELAFQPSLESLTLGVGRLRLVPKKDGFRPIINMRHTRKLVNGKVQVDGNKIDTRKLLQPVLHALESEKRDNPELVGSSVLGKQIFYEKLKEYKRNKCGDGKKFYFVKADIANCFESLDQVKLLEIMKDVLEMESNHNPFQDDVKRKAYVHRDVDVFEPRAKKLVPKSYSSMSTSNSTKHISDEAKTIPRIPPGSIVVDKDTYYKKTAHQLYTLLEKSIAENTVQIGDECLRRTKGIAQGSVLSTLLCSFFFGDFEKRKLSPILERDTEGVLFSYIDDYLYITTNKSCAQWFKNTILYELPKFDKVLFIKKEKSSSNLTEDVEEFVWLGYRINSQTLDVSLDQPQDYLNNMKDSITTNYGSNPGRSLYTSCISDIRSKMFPILMDIEFNSKETVLKNLYDNFRIAAAKLESRTSNIAKSQLGPVNQKFICTIIVQVAINILSVLPRGVSINEMTTEYFRAFYQVFLRKQSRYPSVIPCLRNNYKECNDALTTSTSKSRKRKATSKFESIDAKKRRV